MSEVVKAQRLIFPCEESVSGVNPYLLPGQSSSVECVKSGEVCVCVTRWVRMRGEECGREVWEGGGRRYHLLTLQICSNPTVMLASGPTCEEWREEEGEGGRTAGVEEGEGGRTAGIEEGERGRAAGVVPANRIISNE